MGKCTNPNWRNEDRSKWVAPRRPFTVRTSSSAARQKKQEKEIKISADPYVDTVHHRDTKKVATSLSLTKSPMDNQSDNELSKISLKEFQRVNTPQAPPFSVYSKADAVWGKRVEEASSLRQQRHLLYAKNIRASERMDGVDAFAKRKKEINFGEEVVG